MKINELLYEMMQEINDKEAANLEKELKELSTDQTKMEKKKLQKQERLAIDKIYAEIEMSEKQQDQARRDNASIRFGGKKLVLLVAAAVMMLGMVAFAKEKDWDIEMAEMLGLSSVMEELDGGYVKIGACDNSDGIKVTATQGIGDQNSMWVQLDTDLQWDVGEEGYYIFEMSDAHWYKGHQLAGGHQMYSYNNNGMVSFMWYFTAYEDINRARVEITLSELRAYETLADEDEGYIVSEGSWNLEWENCYASNIVSVRPYKRVTVHSEDGTNKLDCVVREIEISPVSMQVKAWKSPFEDIGTLGNMCYLSVDSIILKDGTKITLDGCSSAGSSNFGIDCFYSFEDMQAVSIDEIDYITIGGEDIKVSGIANTQKN